MKVVLRTDVPDLGQKGDVADVAAGYARNYLLPRGLAMRATEGVELQAATMQKARAERDTADREAATEIATKLVPQVIQMTAKAGEGGRLFGSVSEADVVAAVLDQTSIVIERRQVTIDEPIKELGSHMVTAKLHPDVQFPISVEINAEA